MSLWEHKRAVARLHERGVTQVDEAALFRMIEQMRQITDTASRTTKRMRRDAQRRALAPQPTTATRSAGAEPPLSGEVSSEPAAVRFDQIEQW